MRRNPLRSSLLFAAVWFPSLALGGLLDGDGSGLDPILVGRYSTLETRPLPEQIDLLAAVVKLAFPSGIETVGQALTQILDRSGYRLASLDASCPSTPALLALPLPAVARAVALHRPALALALEERTRAHVLLGTEFVPEKGSHRAAQARLADAVGTHDHVQPVVEVFERKGLVDAGETTDGRT